MSIKVSRRTFLAGSAVAAAAATSSVALSGCGGGESKKEAPKELTAACAYSTTDFSPVGASSALALPSIQHVCEGLYDYDMTTNEIYTALAAGDPEKVNDKEYLIAIREGAKYSDGTDVTAEDVVNAIELTCENGTIGSYMSFLKKAEAADGKVKLTLNYPFELLLKNRLSLVKVFPKSQSIEEAQAKGAIGSGPWMYTSINGDDQGKIEFAPNPNYNGPKPAGAETMTWFPLTDATARITALREENVLVAEDIPTTEVEQVTSAGASCEFASSYAMFFLMFNNRKEPFTDKRVRQALMFAIDYEKMIKNSFDGHARAPKSYLSETHPNFKPAKVVFAYDPEKAKALLKEAGQENLKFTLRCHAKCVDYAAQMKEDWKAVGIDCTIEENASPWGDLTDTKEVLPYDVMAAPGDPSVFGQDPDCLMTWFYDNEIFIKGRTDWAKAKDSKQPELHDLLQQARETNDAQKQVKLWHEALDLLSEEVPLYPFIQREIATAYWPEKVEGYVPLTTPGVCFINAKPL